MSLIIEEAYLRRLHQLVMGRIDPRLLGVDLKTKRIDEENAKGGLVNKLQ
jgi:hypothetical protein